jgi:hypothetical protein
MSNTVRNYGMIHPTTTWTVLYIRGSIIQSKTYLWELFLQGIQNKGAKTSKGRFMKRPWMHPGDEKSKNETNGDGTYGTHHHATTSC